LPMIDVLTVTDEVSDERGRDSNVIRLAAAQA